MAVLDTSLTYMKKLEALDLVVGSMEMQNEAVSGSTHTNVAILEVLDMLEDSVGMPSGNVSARVLNVLRFRVDRLDAVEAYAQKRLEKFSLKGDCISVDDGKGSMMYYKVGKSERTPRTVLNNRG